MYHYSDWTKEALLYTVITTKGTKPSNKKRQGQDPGKKEESIMTSIQINHKNNTIEMTKKFYVESCKYGTDEYKTLQEVRRDNRVIRLLLRRPRRAARIRWMFLRA